MIFILGKKIGSSALKLSLMSVFLKHSFKKSLRIAGVIILFFAFSCSQKQKVDLIVHNAIVYTVDEKFSMAEAFAVKDGKFVETGTSENILAKYEATNMIDAQGKPVYPGFHDAHCHFYGYGNFLQSANLVGTDSFQSILDTLVSFRKSHPDQAWLIGRGWDQNDWDVQEFPEKTALDSLFPDIPVLLTRIDGHAALANQKALDLAKISKDTKVSGGVVGIKDGKLTGILVDNAIGKVRNSIADPSEKEIEKALFDAQEKCFEVGLTNLSDAGLSRNVIEVIDKMPKAGSLQMRMYVMVSSTDEDLEYYLNKGIYKTDFLNVRSFKLYADGALGSRGACLLEPYKDKSDQTGFLLSSPEKLEEMIKKISEKGFQVNTHCIGDSANRLVLDLYGKYLKDKKDQRWRIEHAQVVSKEDQKKFGEFNVIPSVQPTHCTSDMFWALDRLGKPRLRTAYAYKDLLAQNKVIALGSDFPVEDINPLYGFYAAVFRQDANNNPVDGFQMENALTREEALKGMTIWSAYANFEEKEKGSIDAGKFADFVILEEDIMKISKEKIRSVKVWQNYVNGKLVYKKKEEVAGM